MQMTCTPYILVAPSSREAVLTVSPMTVYSMRFGVPTVPAITSPRDEETR